MTATTREVHLPPYRFWETRAGSGTPVVLIHGLGGSADWWRFNIDAIAESHTVAAVDLVGFGRNRGFLRRTPLPLVFDEVAALLIRWIETSFDGPVHLVGHSMGGHVVVHIAAARPDLVRSVVLVDSTGVPFDVDARAHLEHLMVPAGSISFVTVLLRDVFRAGPTSFALAFMRLLRDDARPLMRTLRMPVLLIWGEHDLLVPPMYAERIAEEIPHAEKVIIPRATHNPMWEKPGAFNGALLRFLEEVDAAERGPAERGAFTWGLSGWTGGIAHRQAGRARDVVLVHGLGMSSAYFERLARVLFNRGASPIAPDLRGFGESDNAPAASPLADAESLALWADALGIRGARWIGHSSGCHAVAHLARERPDLVSDVVLIAPLWSRTKHPSLRFMPRLLVDVFREPVAIFPYVMRAYWRAGLARWWRSWLLLARDIGAPRAAPKTIVLTPRGAPAGRERGEGRGDGPGATLPNVRMFAGERDPIPDRETIQPRPLPGAHACHFSHPEECANAIGTSLQR